MDGCYVGRVAVDDPLHPMLCRVLDEGMGVARVRSFDAFRLNGSNEVYAYEECGSGVKLPQGMSVAGTQRAWIASSYSSAALGAQTSCFSKIE